MTCDTCSAGSFNGKDTIQPLCFLTNCLLSEALAESESLFWHVAHVNWGNPVLRKFFPGMRSILKPLITVSVQASPALVKKRSKGWFTAGMLSGRQTAHNKMGVVILVRHKLTQMWCRQCVCLHFLLSLSHLVQHGSLYTQWCGRKQTATFPPLTHIGKRHSVSSKRSMVILWKNNLENSVPEMDHWVTACQWGNSLPPIRIKCILWFGFLIRKDFWAKVTRISPWNNIFYHFAPMEVVRD